MNHLTYELQNAVYTGLIDKKQSSEEGLRPRLLYNDINNGNTILSHFQEQLKKCDDFWFSVAFITQGGLITLKQSLLELEARGIHGKILTTNYLNFSEPRAIEELVNMKNVEVKVFLGDFHVKGYMFYEGEKRNFITGSSNLTQKALKENKEWNVKLTSMDQGQLIEEVSVEFEKLWSEAIDPNEEWLDEYAQIYSEKKKLLSKVRASRLNTVNLKPNKMQSNALKSLEDLRAEGKDKGLLISATGTGKTYLSAFDVQSFKPKKTLFLVHREQILKQAMESFKNVLGEGIDAGLLTGNQKNMDADYLFSTVQTMSKESIYSYYGPTHFDYIIIDETHKAGADSYMKVVNHFRPKFLLGMTATPERTDGKDIYQLFDHNIAYEIRLQQAMEENLLCPFHYFGISDLKIDGKTIDDETEFQHLVSANRVNHIIDKINYYGYSGDRVRGLIFCSNVEEAAELSGLFNQRGYHTTYLTGANDQNTREEAIDKLQKKERKDGLDYIFTVDIFNEGVDIPKVNQVVMLRPTQSSIIFVQQLGRGLRKDDSKDYVVIIDFIGNYKNNFLIPIALSGDNTYNKDNVRRFISEVNRTLPGSSTVEFDAITKQRIYNSIDTTNFSQVKLIREEYTKLKNVIGRIPKLKDFEKFGSLDVMRIFENKSLGSYHEFLKKYEKDYSVDLNDVQEEMISFISQKLASGKRIHELLVLQQLLVQERAILSSVEKLLAKKNISYTAQAKQNTALVLTNDFVQSKPMKGKFKNSVFLEPDGDDYSISKELQRELKSPAFKEMLSELIEFGIGRNQMHFSERYKDTQFVLYQKYTYEDVCKLLNWDKNEVALNIGGYKYDEKTNTFPVFINYHKSENISETIQYEDRFLTPSSLVALSKGNRTPESKDIKVIYGAKDKGTNIYLFVRKNNQDDISKEFYFLGEIQAVGEPNPVVMKNTNNSAVEITYQLETSVRQDIYDYITE